MSPISKSIGIALLILVALLLTPGRPAAAETYVPATLFSQPPDPAGGLYQSSWWSPNESNFDNYLWDNFTLTTTQDITGIQWRGGYDPNVFNGAGAVLDFEVAIYASNGAEPAYLSGPLLTYPTGGNAGQTFAGIFGGVAMYDYSFTLPAAFQAQGGTKYWVYIVAEQTGNPDWGLSKGTGGDTQHFRINHDGSVIEFRSGDLAFTLLGPPTPISGLNATNDSPTALGQATTFIATVSSGSDVSYNWNFGDQTIGSGAIVTHSYAAAGSYTAVVTASNTLGSVTASTAVTVTAVYGVSLSPDQAKSTLPGQSVTYTLIVTNTGVIADSFDLTATGQTWATTLSTSQVNLAPSASANFTVTVAIPPGTADQESDAVMITAVSQGDSSKTDSAALTTTAVSTPVYGVDLSADDSLSGPAGGQVIYTLTITNTGNVVDTFDLLPTGNSWTTTLSSQAVTMNAGGSQALTITVFIPPAAAALASDQVSIEATSRSDSSKSDTAVLTTVSSGQPARIYLPVIISNRSP